MERIEPGKYVELGYDLYAVEADGKETLVHQTDAEDPESPRIPVVDTERCIGCGACEAHCPARPLSAIYVEGHTVHRTV